MSLIKNEVSLEYPGEYSAFIPWPAPFNEAVPFSSDYIAYGLYAYYPHYVVKGLTGDLSYPDLDAPPRHAQGNLLSDNVINFGAMVSLAGFYAPVVYAGTFIGNGSLLTGINKSFDIKHPNKEGWRLRHVCLEGPESAVFYRGRLTNSNVIELPDYWMGLIDPETISVTLTQIGYSQDLIVEKIEWGKRVLIKSGSGANIDCYYVIHAERKDSEKLIPEYEGKTPADYPGNNEQYSIAGYNYDVRLR